MSSNDATPRDESVQLCDLDVGEEIRISARDTSMTVTKADDTRSGKGSRVVAENRHGKYELIQFGSEPASLRVGSEWELVGSVEVKYAN